MKDNFSTQASIYAKYRPAYPAALFEYICSFVDTKDLAWDCGTGNGQAAGALSPYFKNIYATDISEKQIENAIQRNNILYAIEPAEKISLNNNSVDLVTISQALHWFNFDEFYTEVNRVSREHAMIAAWTYNLLQIDPVTDQIIADFHFKILDGYWDKERIYVDEGYKNIPFPFKEIETPEFSIVLNWNTEQLEGYLNTWSAVQKFIAEKNVNPVTEIMQQVETDWPAGELRRVSFPVSLKFAPVF